MMWQKIDDAVFVQMWTAGDSVGAISAHFGVTRATVYLRADRLRKKGVRLAVRKKPNPVDPPSVRDRKPVFFSAVAFRHERAEPRGWATMIVTNAPPNVVKIALAMSSLAVSECLKRGIEPARFYALMGAVQRRQPQLSMSDLFTTTRRWLFTAEVKE